MVVVTKMEAQRTFRIISEENNVIISATSGSCAHKWITKLCNYWYKWCMVADSFTMYIETSEVTWVLPGLRRTLRNVIIPSTPRPAWRAEHSSLTVKMTQRTSSSAYTAVVFFARCVWLSLWARIFWTNLPMYIKHRFSPHHTPFLYFNSRSLTDPTNSLPDCLLQIILCGCL